jgi:DNA-binding LytR/AlgR family response regulator
MILYIAKILGGDDYLSFEINVGVDKTLEGIKVDIWCQKKDKMVDDIVFTLKNYSFKQTLIAEDDERKYSVSLAEIFYIESVDNITYVYVKDKVLKCKSSLAKIEKLFENSSIIRISKSCHLNIDKLDSIRTLINGRYEAKLLNGELLVINRSYVADFKKKFGL